MAGAGTVCGFKRKVIDAQIPKEVLEYPVSCVRTTTDVRKVTCGGCARWLVSAVGAVLARIEGEVPNG